MITVRHQPLYPVERRNNSSKIGVCRCLLMAILYIVLQYHVVNFYGINRKTHLRPLANLTLLSISIAEDFTSSLLFLSGTSFGVI